MNLVLRSPHFLALAVIAVTLSIGVTANAAGWFDNFDDGDVTDGIPVTWNWNQLGFTPGDYDASSGDFRLSNFGTSDGDILAADVDVTFDATYVRTQTFIDPDPDNPENDGGNAGVIARIDPFSFTAYSWVVDLGETGFLTRTNGGVDTTLWEGPTGVNPVEDILVELNVVGASLEGYAWLPGDPKPDTPLFSITDTEPIAAARAGVAYIEDDDNTTGVFRWVQASDEPLPPIITPLEADFDEDGDVDGDDFLLWQVGFGAMITSGATKMDGDWDNDGDVDGDDFLGWQAEFPSPGSGAGSSAVPEPASLGMVVLLAVTAGLARGRRRT